MTYSDHCDTTPGIFNNGHSSPHEDSCSQDFTNSYESPSCGTTYHVDSGVTWNNVGACETYFIDYSSCQDVHAFADTPFYDHSNTSWYDHEDFPFFDHTDTPFYDHDNTAAHSDGAFSNHIDCHCGGGEHHINGYDDEEETWGGDYFCGNDYYYDCAFYIKSEHSDYPHDHWYDWYGCNDPGDLGHTDRAHSHSYTGTNVPDYHCDEAHEHSYYCENMLWDEECTDKGHTDRAHSHSYTGTGTGDDDIAHSHIPHINFCNHSDQYTGGC